MQYMPSYNEPDQFHVLLRFLENQHPMPLWFTNSNTRSRKRHPLNLSHTFHKAVWSSCRGRTSQFGLQIQETGRFVPWHYRIGSVSNRLFTDGHVYILMLGSTVLARGLAMVKRSVEGMIDWCSCQQPGPKSRSESSDWQHYFRSTCQNVSRMSQ